MNKNKNNLKIHNITLYMYISILLYYYITIYCVLFALYLPQDQSASINTEHYIVKSNSRVSLASRAYL